MEPIVNLGLMPHGNAGLKMGWAKVHLDALNREISAFLKSNPGHVIAQDDLETGEYVVRVETDPLPVHIGLILGDFVSCLRGSLDHLACALTLARDGAQNDQAFFPISNRDNPRWRERFDYAVRGIPPEAVKIIESLQPYHRGDTCETAELWKLHRLWNIDKHRRIPLHSVNSNLAITFPANVLPLPGRPSDENVVRFSLAAKPYVNFDPAVQVAVQFGDESEGIIVSPVELGDIYDFVRYKIFPRFKNFFQEGITGR